MNVTTIMDSYNNAFLGSAAACATSGKGACSVEAAAELTTYKDACQGIGNESHYLEVPSFGLSCSLEGGISIDVTVDKMGLCFAFSDACGGLDEDMETMEHHMISLFSEKGLTNCTMTNENGDGDETQNDALGMGVGGAVSFVASLTWYLFI